MGAEFFASPVTALFALAVALVSASAYFAVRSKPLFSKPRLAAGYVLVGLACAAISAISAYVSPAEAVTKWHVPPEKYWSVLLNSYLSTLVLMGSTAIVGIAVVGLPIVATLGKYGRATVPNVLICSVVVSAAVATLLSSGDVTPFLHLGATLAYVITTHLVLSLSFCVGLGLPWRRLQNDA
jgi:hypothetical protein